MSNAVRVVADPRAVAVRRKNMGQKVVEPAAKKRLSRQEQTKIAQWRMRNVLNDGWL